ncbi:MAG: hypothetical protein IT454_17875 [Planctomycetes bacterium]|nr:hypothetical protein [Planctomycetota bacterium]
MRTTFLSSKRMAAVGLVWIGVALSSCGGTDDPYEALKAKDYPTAIKLFEERMAASKPIEDAWLRAANGRVEALAHTDKARAKSEAGALINEHGKALGETKVSNIAQSLAKGGALKEALEVLNDTVKAWPDSVALDSIHSQVFAQFVATASKDDIKSLEGLGYAGGGEKKFEPRQGSQTPKDKLPQN